MAAGAARLCVTFLFVSASKFVCAVVINIPAVSGQTAILSCRTQNESIVVVEWSRPDLKNKHVLFYRDEQFDPDNQHPSFKNRVDLQDRQMKDGDVSLILKNATINDTGTYECRIFVRGANYKKRAILETEPICIIYLRVVAPPGPSGGTTEDGSFGLIVGLLLSVVLLLGLVFFIYRRWKQQSQGSDSRPDAQRQQLQTSQ